MLRRLTAVQRPWQPPALDSGAVIRRGLTRAVDLLLPLALLAAAAALVVPSQTLAERSDFLLAGLVLLTALCIPPSHLLSLRARKVALALLVLAPGLPVEGMMDSCWPFELL